MSFVLFLLCAAGCVPAVTGVAFACFGKPVRRFGLSLLLAAVSIWAGVLLDAGAVVFVENLWFADLGFSQVYWQGFKMRSALLLVGGVTSGLFAALALRWAVRPLELLVPFADNGDHYGDNYSSDSHRFWLQALPILRWIAAGLVATIVGFVLRNYWQEAQLFLAGESFGEVDPVFGLDLSFYIFRLEMYEVTLFLATATIAALIVLALLAVASFAAITSPLRRVDKEGALVALRACLSRISWFGGLLLLALAAVAYLWPYSQLFSQDGRIAGVSWMDINVRFKANWVLIVALVESAVVLVIFGRPPYSMRTAKALGISAAVLLLAVIASPFVVEPIARSMVLKGSEQQAESVYIDRTIDATRKAFKLDAFKVEQFDPKDPSTLNFAALREKAPATLENLRMWGPASIAPNLRETQTLKGYYAFPDVDLDRYMIDGKQRLLVLGSRELDPQRLPKEAHSWVNDRLLYTHGYGVTAALANEASASGDPDFKVKDMPVVSTLKGVAVPKPQLYFGEHTIEHVYVNVGTDAEFDHPTDGGEGYAKSSYQGERGIRLGTGLRRLALAWKYDGFRGLMSTSLNENTKLLAHRTIVDRIGTIAPFLHIDADPYKVILKDRLVYVVDGYTGSSRYPYSRSPEAAPRGWSYLRNSVKVVVDAYDGTVEFYQMEDEPVLRSWMKIHPGLVKPLAEMPAEIRQHLRYPEELFALQASLYGSYHMEADAWFQQLDRWELARDAAEPKDKDGNHPAMSPYYVVGQLPNVDHEEFLLFVPLTVQGRNNLASWMVARNDGEHLNEVHVYRFPAQRQVMGPALVRGRIEQDAQLSAYLTFWRNKGSQVLLGNLLTLPVGGTLMHVEPISIKAESSPTPQLKLVVVSIGDRVAFGQNFAEAVNRLFDGQPASVPNLPPGVPGLPVAPVTGGDAKLQEANRVYHRYLELTGQGKVQEAGAELERLGRILNGQ